MVELFKRFVQPGRLAIGNYGKIHDKPVIIVDILTTGRVIIDNPQDGVRRQVVPVSFLQLTDFVLEGISRGATSFTVKNALEAHNVVDEWKKSSWGQKKSGVIAKRLLGDFDRFRVIRAKAYVAKQYREKAGLTKKN